ncbi:MAG: hypothetical protein JXA15_04040 [Spirochaetales bacterium]|nr:hypothetical protein [Spirochaetales bacterium]
MSGIMFDLASFEALTQAQPWARFAAQERGLFGAAVAGAGLETARRASIGSSLMLELLEALRAWPGTAIASHKSPEQAFHKLAFAAELGLRRGDHGVDDIAESVMSRVSEEGPFTLPSKVSAAHGGSGEETRGWALCDAPVILRALVRMGYGDDPRVARAIDFLVPLARENGYPCAVSSTFGAWRGPGKKSDPCPYATLVMLELLLELPGRREGAEARAAAECLLRLRERSREEHPYIFYMGDDFRKLKAPLIWYDLVHVLETLSKAPWIRGDARLESMLDVLESKAGPGGLFTPESAYQAWKAYDFGQKKLPSVYLSAVALGILKRSGRLVED